MAKAEHIERGSGNVFADIGLPDAGAHLLKAELVRRIAIVMKDRALTQTSASKLMGVSQPDLSKLLRGLSSDWTADRLLRMLSRLDAEIEITVRRDSEPVGEPIRLEAASS